MHYSGMALVDPSHALSICSFFPPSSCPFLVIDGNFSLYALLHTVALMRCSHDCGLPSNFLFGWSHNFGRDAYFILFIFSFSKLCHSSFRKFWEQLTP